MQQINLAASLSSGQAVAVGSAYAPQGEFFLSGGATAVPAKPIVYLQGTGFFDTTQRNLTQNGFLAYGTSETQSTPTELARQEIPSPSANLNAGNPPTTTLPAVGSINQNLAVVTSMSNGQNVVSLYNASNLASTGTITLNDANPLTDLSESFHPELSGTALVDVQGNLRSFRAQDAKGLVVNDNGFLNLVQIASASDSEVVGQPIGHVRMPVRKHVLLLSSSRSVGTRGGVVTVPNFQPVGPLSLPNNSG